MAVVNRNKPSNWLEPFLVEESAIKALQTMLENDKVTRGGMYCLEIINQIIQNGTRIFERLPQEVFSGCPEGGRRNVAASALCRAGNGEIPAEPETPSEDGLTRSQRIVGSWAERDGCWSDYTDTDQEKAGRLHNPAIDGSESRVWFDKDGYVYKTMDFSHYISMAAFLDRIAIHNAIFPETALTVEGFGWRDDASDYEDYVAVVRQPYVAGNPPDTDKKMKEVRRKVEEKGFKEMMGLFYVSESGNILLSDIHNRNCVVTDKGSLLVFDCEAILNQSPDLKGKYTIPAIRYDDGAVSAIRRTVEELLPRRMSLEELFDPKKGYFESESGRRQAAAELAMHKALQRPLKGCAVQLDPEDPKGCLVMPAASISRMLENFSGSLDDGTMLDRSEIVALSEGRQVIRDGVRYAFNLDKGRVDKVYDGPRLRLQMSNERRAGQSIRI